MVTRLLLPSSTSAPPVFHSRPFTLAHDGKTRAVNDKMKRPLGRPPTECEIELLTPARQGSVIQGIEVNPHHRQHGPLDQPSTSP